MKSNFFANISHEFRTPLTLILGILKKKNETIERGDQQTMQRNADRLLQLINQLLDLAKLESGKMDLNRVGTNISSLAKRTAQLFSGTPKTAKINFKAWSTNARVSAKLISNKCNQNPYNIAFPLLQFLKSRSRLRYYLNIFRKKHRKYANFPPFEVFLPPL